jgi:hypothetical protein
MDKSSRSVKLINHLYLMRKLRIGENILPIAMPCKLFVLFNIYRSVHCNTECLTRCRTRHFCHNFISNKDITTKFEAVLRHCVKNVKEKKVLIFKFRCNIFNGVRIIKEMPGSVERGTLCIFL